MKHYKILSAEGVGAEDILAEYVQTAINDGWELAGTMQIGPGKVYPSFYQPIIKIKPDRLHGKAINPGPVK